MYPRAAIHNKREENRLNECSKKDMQIVGLNYSQVFSFRI